MRTTASLVCLSILSSSAIAQQQQESQAVTVGPWNIATTYKGDKFDYCTMTRSASGLGVTFVRNQDGLLLLLDSSKWKLERGKAYTVRLAVGSHSVDAKALAETKSVTIAFAYSSFTERLRTPSMLDVRAEGATLHVPLIGIGGSLAAPPLPHHRTYGSVYGGSRSYANAFRSNDSTRVGRSGS